MWNDGPVSREEGPSDLSGMGNFVTNTHLGTLSQTGSEWERNVLGSGERLGLLGIAVRLYKSSLQHTSCVTWARNLTSLFFICNIKMISVLQVSCSMQPGD